jgi:hypothetical protein
MQKLAAALCCVAVLALSACGGTSDEDTAKDNLKAKMLDGSDSLGTKATDKEATCISDGMVDDLGIEKLQKYKFLNDKMEVSSQAGSTPLSKEDAETFAKVYVKCIDMKELLTERQAGADKFTPSQKDCIGNALDEDVLEQGLASLFQGKQDPAYTKMQLKIQKCTANENKVLPKQ